MTTKTMLHGNDGIFSMLEKYKAVQAGLSAKKTKKTLLKQQIRAGLLDQKQKQQSLKSINEQDFQQNMLVR